MRVKVSAKPPSAPDLPPLAICPSLVDAVARATVRRRGLPFQDLDDLRSALWVKLLDRDSRVVRRFTGRGNLFAYLLRVAHRLVLDEQTTRLGRWRPSLRAARLGAGAVAWSKMVQRDGMSPAEVSSRLDLGPDVDRSRLDAILSLSRPPTRRFVPLERCPPTRLAAIDGRASVEVVINRDACQKIRSALLTAIGELTVEERRLLRLRFTEGLRISEIARLDRRRPMEYYREYSRLLDSLRKRLAAAGIDAGLVAVAESQD